jgi:twitching motility protein PilT
MQEQKPGNTIPNNSGTNPTLQARPAQPQMRPPLTRPNTPSGQPAQTQNNQGERPAMNTAAPNTNSSPAPATPTSHATVAEKKVIPPAPAEMMEKIVHYATHYNLSDIHIHSDEAIALREHGSIEVQENDFIKKEKIEKFLEEILDEEQKVHFTKIRDVDLAIVGGGMRFRVNAYMTLNGPAMVLRKIETEAPDIEVLNLPKTVYNITTEKNGLVLVTGPTGSGKSTTLASIIKKINTSRKANIVTIEDPVEFIHESKKSLVSQREVGKDAFSFATALKAVLRQDPDIILLGEMRDLETVSLALTAAETGHLVFGTLHTNGAPNSINRILDVFPPEQQAQARSQLSQSIRLVVTQRLIKRADGKGRVAAFEVMKSCSSISNLIREGKIFQIEQAMQTSKADGNLLMKDSIKQLLLEGKIRQEDVADAH